MSIKYTVKPTTRFLKDYKLMQKRGADMSLIDDVIAKLAQGIPLSESNRDHSLSGNYAHHRECHIAPDWLLVYHIDEGILVLSLTRTGSHSDLF
jgi:mRNA interferase YafQ